MAQRDPGLRVRVAIALVAVVALSSIAFAAWIYFANDRLENELFDTLLYNELQGAGSDRSQPAGSGAVQIYFGASGAPPLLAALPAGSYHGLSIEGRAYHVLVTEVDRQRAIATYDITPIEASRHRTLWMLAAGVVAVCVLAGLLGLWIAGSLTAPIRDIADRVGELQPDRADLAMSHRYHQREAQMIARAFDRFIERLSGFIERERSFVAAASHELRTPLTVIQAAAEYAETTELPPRAARALLRIRHARQQMTGFIESLLFLAREEGVPAAGEGTQLAETLERIVADNRYMLSDKPVELDLHIEAALHVEAPPTMVDLVIGNLVRNAMRFTERGRIEVVLRGRTVSVRDTGRGISPEHLARVFERHFRADSAGMGLGLYIAGTVAERYGWRLELASTPGRGTLAEVHF